MNAGASRAASGPPAGLKTTFSIVMAAALAGAAAAPHQHPAADQPQVLAPGYGELSFDPPAAGTYTLPSLGPAADGTVLDGTGQAASLHALYRDKVIVLGFIFTSCTDVNGCPLASFVLGQVQKRILGDADLADRVRLISLSFDPAHDTPEVMQAYGRNFRQEDFDWLFLTCSSEAQLEPILADYGQSVIRDYDSEGRALGSMSHLLRVYLIDRDKHIRNIYSPAFLHPDILLADIRTVLAD